MPRALPSQVFRFIASISVIVLLTPLSPALPQQKPAPPSPHSQTQEDRVKELETRLNAAEQKAASAAMEKDYIIRIQRQYETYYEKAFNTQVTIVSVLALFITIVLAVAARFGFQTFDRRIDTALRETSAQLRTEFNQQLRAELEILRQQNSAQLKALEDGLTKRITEQQQDLKTQSRYQFDFAQGLAAGADDRFADARAAFRRAVNQYKSGKARQLIPIRAAATALRNIFVQFPKEDEANSAENAKKELADEFYNDLGDELALAAASLTWLQPLLKERK
jgi:hypothetical protein